MEGNSLAKAGEGVAHFIDREYLASSVFRFLDGYDIEEIQGILGKIQDARLGFKPLRRGFKRVWSCARWQPFAVPCERFLFPVLRSLFPTNTTTFDH